MQARLRESDDAERHESECERDESKRARYPACSFHPSRLDGIPKDPFKDDDAKDKHDKPGDRIPLNYEPKRERDVNKGTSDGRNEAHKHDEYCERDEKRHA